MKKKKKKKKKKKVRTRQIEIANDGCNHPWDNRVPGGVLGSPVFSPTGNKEQLRRILECKTECGDCGSLLISVWVRPDTTIARTWNNYI